LSISPCIFCNLKAVRRKKRNRTIDGGPQEMLEMFEMMAEREAMCGRQACKSAWAA
jgi:hypothetical protein